MTRKMILAEKAYIEAEQAYGEANRAAKVAANDAITQDVAIVPELIVDPTTTPQQFGKILSAPKRKHIDDWLDENHTQAVPSPRALHRKNVAVALSFPRAPGPEDGSLGDGLTVVEGAKRRQIDAYNRYVQSQ